MTKRSFTRSEGRSRVRGRSSSRVSGQTQSQGPPEGSARQPCSGGTGVSLTHEEGAEEREGGMLSFVPVSQAANLPCAAGLLPPSQRGPFRRPCQIQRVGVGAKVTELPFPGRAYKRLPTDRLSFQ